MLRDGFVVVGFADGEADGHVGSDGLADGSVGMDQEIVMAVL